MKWKKLLKERKANCYIKPNRHIHDSGFRCFETGYLTLSPENRVKKKIILGEYSDHIWISIPLSDIGNLNMDLTLDGHIRIWSTLNVIWWGGTNFNVSSAMLQIFDE